MRVVTRRALDSPRLVELHGIVGSFLVVGVATLLALPVGILAGIFLAEYPSTSASTFIRFCTDVLSPAPSIIVGVVLGALTLGVTLLLLQWMLPQRSRAQAVEAAPAELEVEA